MSRETIKVIKDMTRVKVDIMANKSVSSVEEDCIAVYAKILE